MTNKTSIDNFMSYLSDLEKRLDDKCVFSAQTIATIRQDIKTGKISFVNRVNANTQKVGNQS